MKKILFFLILFFLLLTPRSVFAQNAYYFLETTSTHIPLQSAFLVQVFVNSGEEPINTIRVGLEYPKTNLSLLETNLATSMFPNLVENNTNEPGIIYLTAFTVNPYQGERGLVATLKFQAIKNGDVKINILPDSKIHVADGIGTNIFNYQETPKSFSVVISSNVGGQGGSTASHPPGALPSPASDKAQPPPFFSNISNLINKITRKGGVEPEMMPADVEKEKELTADKNVVDYTVSSQTKAKQFINKLLSGKVDSQILYPLLTIIITLAILIIIFFFIKKIKKH